MHRIIAEKMSEIIEICRRHRVKTLELFGSAAGKNFDPERSDLDFIVAVEPMPPDRPCEGALDEAIDLDALYPQGGTE